MRLRFIHAALPAVALLGGCVSMTGPAATTSAAGAPAATSQAPHDRLFALFAASDEAMLQRNPMAGLYRGDPRFGATMGDPLSDAHNDAERRAAQQELAALRRIDRASLNETDQIAYDVFAYEREETLRQLGPDLLPYSVVRPINHFYGLHTGYATLASGRGGAPFKTAQDYANNLSRHAEFSSLIDQIIGRMRQGLRSGVVESQLTVRNMVSQLDTQLAQPLEDSPYWGPTKMFPDSFTAAQKQEETAKLRASLNRDIFPALRRLRTFLNDEYLPRARPTVGLSTMRGGPQTYAERIRSSTTLAMSADEIHNLGLSEVARIRGEMDKVRREVNFQGNLPAFFEHLRTDSRFKMATREALTQGYVDIGRRVDALVPRYFRQVPRSALEIRPYEPFRERFEAGGSYDSGTPDGSRPGIFYFNAYDLPSRTTPGMTTLYLHEGAPGHHFQISLAQENTALPNFMRFGGNTAYVEGWALYAETLGYEMGLYTDPYQRFGTLSDEMLRAMRLVVDTGLHSKGWTREQAIDYMLANSDMGRTDATAEVERYIAIPGQALAYKIGALTIQRLRRKAESELGSRFDIRDFHQQVLGTGGLPLPVLEAKINRWIARGGGA